MNFYKRIFCLLVLALTLLACGENRETSAFKEEASDSSSKAAEIKNDPLIIQPSNDSADTWKFNQFLNSPYVPQLAKDIFLGKTSSFKEEIIISFLDSLNAINKASRPFYFKVITNSYKIADGAYAEALGNAGKVYTERNTREFLNYFKGNNAFSKEELFIWSKIVMLELAIIAEDKSDRHLLKDYLSVLKRNCKEITLEEKSVLDHFSKLVTEQFNSMFEQE